METVIEPIKNPRLQRSNESQRLSIVPAFSMIFVHLFIESFSVPHCRALDRFVSVALQSYLGHGWIAIRYRWTQRIGRALDSKCHVILNQTIQGKFDPFLEPAKINVGLFPGI
jgi:hypothetical protein